MTLNEKLKNFSKTGKAWVLSAAVTMAGVMGVHAQNAQSYNGSDKRSTITYQSHEKYELHAGVLMPKAGETQQEYEARRMRLEKQDQQLHNRMAQNARRQLTSLKARKASARLIEAAEDNLERHEAKIHYISWYTPEGQQRLKVYNSNPLRAGTVQSNQSQMASVRRGKTYDF